MLIYANIVIPNTNFLTFYFSVKFHHPNIENIDLPLISVHTWAVFMITSMHFGRMRTTRFGGHYEQNDNQV